MNNRVVVVGAGPVGLCLSLALAARGMEVDVIDRQDAEALAAPAFDGREIALTPAATRLLREIGVWQRIPADEVAPIHGARVMDGADSGFGLNGAAFGRDQLGVLVPNHVIRAAAWQTVAAEARIAVHAGMSVDAVEMNDEAARIRLADAMIFRAPLVIAADGRFSETRRKMGIPVHMHDFGKSMLVARVRHAVANDATAWEWFGRGQSRALLPLGAHLSSVVLTVTGAEAQRLLHLSTEEFAADVVARFEGRLGAVELASTRHAYPLVATWARAFVARRFALAGDAAVGMHPVTAHGFNLGLVSVRHLAATAGAGLERHGDPGHPAMLARYQRRHRAECAPMFAGTQAIAQMFTDERRVAQPLRRAVMGAARRIPPMRRALVAGMLDDTPRPLSLARHLKLGLAILRPHVAHAPGQKALL